MVRQEVPQSLQGQQAADFPQELCMIMINFQLFVNTFTLTFIAEWGDRSQLATIVLAGILNTLKVSLNILKVSLNTFEVILNTLKVSFILKVSLNTFEVILNILKVSLNPQHLQSHP